MNIIVIGTVILTRGKKVENIGLNIVESIYVINQMTTPNIIASLTFIFKPYNSYYIIVLYLEILNTFVIKKFQK